MHVCLYKVFFSPFTYIHTYTYTYIAKVYTLCLKTSFLKLCSEKVSTDSMGGSLK